jgi:hypothetical protein
MGRKKYIEYLAAEGLRSQVNDLLFFFQAYDRIALPCSP